MHLTGEQVAIILEDDKEGEEVGELKVALHLPDIDLGKEYVPFTVSMAACVREFLNDQDWVAEAQKRLASKNTNKQA